MDIESLLQKFCNYSISIKGLSNKTIMRYKQVVKYFCNFANITNIEEVTNDIVRNMFYDGRIKRSWSPNTFLHYHKTLIVFFCWCVKNGYLLTSPMNDIEVPKLAKKLPKKLTKQEAMKILEITYNYPWQSKFVRYRNYAILSMFIFAGLRKQEVINLKFTDVDIENQTIFIKQGKGNKDRVIPMNSHLVEILNKYIKERENLNKTCSNFFTSNIYNIGFCDSGVRLLINKISSSANIYFTAHKLRHTFATLMLEGGCDIYSLSRMMGHNNIKTTCIYLYASVEHLRNQITKHPLNNI